MTCLVESYLQIFHGGISHKQEGLPVRRPVEAMGEHLPPAPVVLLVGTARAEDWILRLEIHPLEIAFPDFAGCRAREQPFCPPSQEVLALAHTWAYKSIISLCSPCLFFAPSTARPLITFGKTAHELGRYLGTGNMGLLNLCLKCCCHIQCTSSTGYDIPSDI